LGFVVVDVAAVAEGVVVAYIIRSFVVGGNIAPGVVDIAANQSANIVQNGDHITLDIGDIVIGAIVVSHRHTWDCRFHLIRHGRSRATFPQGEGFLLATAGGN